MDSSIDEISGEDRSISELPDDILIHILSFLTATDMEAISALPRRWKSLSKLFPNRDFKKATGSLYSIQREVQLLNDKVRIREFDLLIWHQLSCSSDLTSLITEVLKHKVEKLQILCDPEWEGIMPWPDSLLTSDSLTSLKLGGNLLRIRFPTSISFPRLKTLHLYSIDIEEEHNAKQFFSDYHYPVLEELELGACRWINYDNYNNKVAIILGISISSLQRLAIANGDPANCTCYGEANESLWVRINCSNLQYLRLSCVHFDFVGGYSSLSSLAEAELELRTRRQPRHYFAHRTLEFLKIIRHVKHLELTQNTLQTMSYARRLDVPALFSNLTHLRVWTPTSIGAAPLMRILQNSPNLQSLDCPLGFRGPLLPQEKLFKKNDVPLCLKHSLKTFSTSRFEGEEAEVHFLKYILQNADALEHFTVEYCIRPAALKMSIEQDLTRLFRKNCANIIFLSTNSSQVCD